MGMDPAPAHTRWAPPIVISFITPINDLIQRVTGVITQLITSRGPPCRLFVYLTIYYTEVYIPQVLYEVFINSTV